MKKFINENKFAILSGILIYVYSIFTTQNYFQFSYSEFDTFAWGRYIFLRVTFLVLDFSIVFLLKNLIKRIKMRDKGTINFIKFFGIALIINTVFLLLIWPGNWINDELGVLYNSRHFIYNSWQNYLTEVFFSECLMIIPSAISIIVIQVIFISLSFGYFVSYIYKITETRLIYILYIILFMPPVIYNNLYPLRITMYSYLELMFITWILKKYKEGKAIDIKTVVISAICIFILCFWRSEGIYYIVVPVILFLLFRKTTKNIIAKCIVIECVVLTLFTTFSGIDKHYNKEAYVKYKMTAIINPLSILLQNDLKGNVEKDLEQIDKVIDVELLKQNPSYWNIIVALDESLGLYRENITDNYNSNVLKSYLRIIANNFPEFINERVEVYRITNGKYEDENRYYSLNGVSDFKVIGTSTDRVTNDFLGKPISNSIRDNFIKILRGEKFNSIKIFWNVTPIVIGNMVVLVLLIIRKKIAEALIVINLFIKSILVFLTTPATFFMYYYPFYLEGALIICACIIYLIKSERGEVK